MPIDPTLNYRIVSVFSSQAATVQGDSEENNAFLIQSNWQNLPHQKWRLIALGGADAGFFQILSVNGGKVLTVTNVEPNIFQFDWTAGENQKWAVVALADGRNKIRNKESNLFFTTANINVEATIDQTADANNQTQEWFIVESV